MGRLGRRLEALEERERAEAAGEVRGAWAALSDEEAARTVAPYYHSREAAPGERAAEERARALMPEDLIARAIGYREGMAPEEVRRRMGALIGPALEGRRSRIGRRLDAMGGTS